MTSMRRSRVSLSLIAALAALLVFAATAAAEVRTGEGSAVISEGTAPPPPEAAVVKGTASYDTSSGETVIDAITAAEPQALNEHGEENKAVTMLTGLFQSGGECSSGIGTVAALTIAPEALIVSGPYGSPISLGILGSIETFGTNPKLEGVPLVVVGKTVAGTKTTFSASSSLLAGKGFNCAFILTEATEEFAPHAQTGDFMAFPITGPPAPPAPSAAAASTPPPSTPAAAPAALAIAGGKPLTLRTGKWKTVEVKVTNTGGTATAPGTLRVKGAKGVQFKPASQKLPALSPGASWTVPVRVQLTDKAKKTSTLTLSGLASGVSAKASLVLKLAGS